MICCSISHFVAKPPSYANGSGLSPLIVYPDPAEEGPPDPYALAELSRDVRPPDYATVYVRQACALSGLDHPIWVCCRERPRWLRAVVEEPGVREAPLADALAACAAA